MNAVWLVFVGVIGLAVAGCDAGAGEDRPRVRVSAAASLGPVLESLRPGLESELGVRVQLNLASSGTLARQVLDGAPADVVILAHPDWMTPLVDTGRVEADDVVSLASNTLVVVGPGPPIELHQLAEARFKRIALGDPASVPAGRYAEQALRDAGVWEAFEGRRVTTADVRAALRYAQTGDVDAAIVYASDAVGLSPGGVSVLCAIDPTRHDPIVISAGVVDASPAGQRLLDALRGEAAERTFAEAGFGAAQQVPR